MEYKNVISLFGEDLTKGLAALYEKYGQQLYSFAVTHFHIDEDESYDVLYQTLETVGKVITRYEFSSGKHFANWLFKIHKNNILQLLRTKKNKETLLPYHFSQWQTEVDELQEESFSLNEFQPLIHQISNTNPYDDTPASGHLMTAMEQALQLLSDLEKELLLLRMSNYTYDEIAQMLDIENNQLKVKFNRAKAKVEKHTLALLKDKYYGAK